MFDRHNALKRRPCGKYLHKRKDQNNKSLGSDKWTEISGKTYYTKSFECAYSSLLSRQTQKTRSKDKVRHISRKPLLDIGLP